MITISLGPTPCYEECVQVGTEGYATLARQECTRYIRQLKRHYHTLTNEDLPENVTLSLTLNPHDFGSYYDVVIHFDETDKKAEEAAFFLEAHLPNHWDFEAFSVDNSSERSTSS